VANIGEHIPKAFGLMFPRPKSRSNVLTVPGVDGKITLFDAWDIADVTGTTALDFTDSGTAENERKKILNMQRKTFAVTDQFGIAFTDVLVVEADPVVMQTATGYTLETAWVLRPKAEAPVGYEDAI
jgi:hypothetical protein